MPVKARIPIPLSFPACGWFPYCLSTTFRTLLRILCASHSVLGSFGPLRRSKCASRVSTGSLLKGKPGTAQELSESCPDWSGRAFTSHYGCILQVAVALRLTY
jgi:hypothetical protein